MTIWDFLAQAGFWQWVGLLLLASIICKWAAVAIFGIFNRGGSLRVE